MCATCGRRLRHATWRYCGRRCQAVLRRVALEPWAVLAALNSGRPAECVAADLAVSRATLYRYCRREGIVRIAGLPHRPGRYALVARTDRRQLRWC